MKFAKALLIILIILFSLLIIAVAEIYFFEVPKLAKYELEIDPKTFFYYRFFGSGYDTLKTDELLNILKKNKGCCLFIDIRRRKDYEKGHIEHFINIPFNELIQATPSPIEKNKRIIIICYKGNQSHVAAALLSERGYEKISHVSGGMDKWMSMTSSSRE